MKQAFYIGVDGGATKCQVRLEDASGKLLGQAVSGPANIRISVDQAWQSIYFALEQILQPLSLSLKDETADFYLGLGLAGFEIQSAKQAFLAKPHPFKQLILSSDAHTACLGAHGGQDGAIIIVGTGTVALQLINGRMIKTGGYGFPHSDEGGGAWLGLEAVKLALRSLDNRALSSNLTNAVLAKLDNQPEDIVSWANQANSTAFATLAPLIIHYAKQADPSAIDLLKKAAGYIIEMAMTIDPSLPIALVGSLSTFIKSYMQNEHFVRCLREPFSPPEAGAIFLLRKN